MLNVRHGGGGGKDILYYLTMISLDSSLGVSGVCV